MKAFITLEYKGERVTVEDTGTDRKSIEFYWDDGNLACDCNRSRAARSAGAEWPELECSNEQITVVEMKFEGD